MQGPALPLQGSLGGGEMKREWMDRSRRRSATAYLLCCLLWGVSGAWAGDGIVALQTADPSCRTTTTPPPRYVDCGNGTVTDNKTGLVWLKQANCIGAAGGGTGVPLGRVNWHTAMEFVAGLSDLRDDPLDCGLSDGSSPGDWRLPSVTEWQEMMRVRNLGRRTSEYRGFTDHLMPASRRLAGGNPQARASDSSRSDGKGPRRSSNRDRIRHPRRVP